MGDQATFLVWCPPSALGCQVAAWGYGGEVCVMCDAREDKEGARPTLPSPSMPFPGPSSPTPCEDPLGIQALDQPSFLKVHRESSHGIHLWLQPAAVQPLVGAPSPVSSAHLHLPAAGVQSLAPHFPKPLGGVTQPSAQNPFNTCQSQSSPLNLWSRTTSTEAL